MRLAAQLLGFVVGAWLLGLALVGAIEYLVRHGDIAGWLLKMHDAANGTEDEEGGK